MPTLSKNCELILALDVPTRKEASAILDKIGGSLDWVKIGLQLFTMYGPSIVEDMHKRGYKVFLDLKLHDIPNTVAKAVASICELPVDLTTLHVMGGTEMLTAANETRLKLKPSLNLLGVTVLTSHDRASIAAIGIDDSTEEQVLRLARLGLESGLQGLVCAPLELDSLRETLGSECILVTPGIRPSGADMNDQKRATTPAIAAQQGSNYIVVGRPILNADAPQDVIKSIQQELSQA